MTSISFPIVSVIVPAFNAERHIGKAIDSVLAQTLDSWELLIIDDGSTDATPKIVQSYKDCRIDLVRQANLGVSAARNSGLAKMRGRYFTFLDADDELPARALELQVKAMEKKGGLDFLAGNVLQRDVEGGETTWRPSFQGDPLREFIRLNQKVFFGVCLFLRRHDSVRYRFPEGLSHCEDLLFFIETSIQMRSCQYEFINEPVYIRNLEPNSAMSNLDGLAKGYRELFRRVWHLSDKRVRLTDKVYLKFRYVRIMLLSYFAARRYAAVWKILLDLIGLRLSLGSDRLP